MLSNAQDAFTSKAQKVKLRLPCFCFFFFNFISVWLLYNAVLFSDPQHSDSAICFQNHKQLSIWLRAKAQVLSTVVWSIRHRILCRHYILPSPLTGFISYHPPCQCCALVTLHLWLFLNLTHRFPISGARSAVPSAYSAVSPVLIIHPLTSFETLVAQSCLTL